MDAYDASSPKPAKDPGSLAALAAKVAAGSDRPVLVRFGIEQALSPGDAKDKPLAKAASDSRALVSLFDMMDQDLSMTARMFRLVSVDVSGVDPKDSPEVNRLNAPVVAVLDAEGNLVKALGPGAIRRNDLMAALAQALKPRISIEKLLAEEKAIMREVMDLETLKSMVASKRSQLERAKGPTQQKLEAEVQDLEKKLADRESALKAREAQLYGKG